MIFRLLKKIKRNHKGSACIPQNPGEICPFCRAKLDGTMATFIMHLFTIHPELFPKMEHDEFNPSARNGKSTRDMTDTEYLDLVKMLKKLEGKKHKSIR